MYIGYMYHWTCWDGTCRSDASLPPLMKAQRSCSPEYQSQRPCHHRLCMQEARHNVDGRTTCGHAHKNTCTGLTPALMKFELSRCQLATDCPTLGGVQTVSSLHGAVIIVCKYKSSPAFCLHLMTYYCRCMHRTTTIVHVFSSHRECKRAY